MKTKQKSLRQLAKEIGVSESYLSQVKNGNRPPSQKVISKFNKVISKNGGSVWESNPPKTLLMPPDGFEVREAHRGSYAPLLYILTYNVSGTVFFFLASLDNRIPNSYRRMIGTATRL